mgnify:CR=1 FL=1
MKKNEFDSQLSALGVDFLDAGPFFEASKALVQAVGKKELRYWEVFPALLANAAEQGTLDHASAQKGSKSRGTRKAFDSLVCLSLGLFKALGLQFSWAVALFSSLNSKSREQVSVFEQAFRKGDDLRVAGKALSGERVKLTFQRYFKPAARSLTGLLAKREEFGLEYSLSRVFSPKQKELFLKKLKGEKFTKTENEYFSRTVRKKAVALADPELHRLARELLK